MESFFRTTAAIFAAIATLFTSILIIDNSVSYATKSSTTISTSARSLPSYIHTLVSVRTPPRDKTDDSLLTEFLDEHLKYPMTLLVPDGFLTFLSTKKGCNRTYMIYPKGGLVGQEDRSDHKFDVRFRLKVDDVAYQRLTVTTIKVDKDMELGRYNCVCGKNSSTPIYSIDVLYRPCISPSSRCQYSETCSKNLSQLMGCLMVKTVATGREPKVRKSSIKCEKLTTDMCAQIHGYDRLYSSKKHVVCTSKGLKLNNLCEAVSSGNAVATPIYYIRASNNRECSTKNIDRVYPRAVYWQQTPTPTGCNFEYRDRWKLMPIQAFVYTERDRPITLCYICHSIRSGVNYTIEYHKDYPSRGTVECKKMAEDSYVAFLNISTPVNQRTRIRIAEPHSYVDIVSASYSKKPDLEDKVLWSVESVFHLDGHINRHNCTYWALENPQKQIEMSLKLPEFAFGRDMVQWDSFKSSISRLSFSARNIYVTCGHDMDRHEPNPANAYVEYEWRDPYGSAAIYPDTREHGHTHELVSAGNHTCYVKLKSCYFRTDHWLSYSSSVYEALFATDSSTIYLVVAISIITLLIATIIGVVLYHVCKQRMAKRRFMFLTGNAEDKPCGKDHIDASVYGEAGVRTRSSNQPSLITPQKPRSKYLKMIKMLTTKKSTKSTDV